MHDQCADSHWSTQWEGGKASSKFSCRNADFLHGSRAVYFELPPIGNEGWEKIMKLCSPQDPYKSFLSMRCMCANEKLWLSRKLLLKSISGSPHSHFGLALQVFGVSLCFSFFFVPKTECYLPGVVQATGCDKQAGLNSILVNFSLVNWYLALSPNCFNDGKTRWWFAGIFVFFYSLGRRPTSSKAAALIFRVSILFFEAKSHLHFVFVFTQQR